MAAGNAEYIGRAIHEWPQERSVWIIARAYQHSNFWLGVTQLAGGHSGDEPSNGGWPPGGWLPWPHTNSPLSATDTPPAAKRLARPEANDPES